MNHTATLITALLATLALSTPASALELRDAARTSSQALERGEANYVVGEYLGEYLGPTVANKNAGPAVKVWGCRTESNVGTCRGRVAAGTVMCAGTFRVRETRKTWWVFPERVTCAAA